MDQPVGGTPSSPARGAEVGVGPHPLPWPDDARLDPELLREGDRRNVVDRYRYWRVEAIVADLDRTRHPFHVAIENLEHDFNIGSVVRTANAFNAASVRVVGRRRWNRRGAMVTDRYQHVRHHPSVADLADYLRLCPFARVALARLGDWLGKANEERAAVLRLIFRDAAEVQGDSAPRLMEMLLGHVPEAAQILRPISLITERAGDRYLASSELAGFGERLLDRAEEHVGLLTAFLPADGPDAARRAAQNANAAGAILAEIEQAIELAQDGPWGRRVLDARKSMSAMIESRLRECQKAVEMALPMQSVRITGRMTRPSPKVSAAPDPRFVEPARALMVLLGETRQAANSGGFGALRSQVAEALSDWLEVYADELVHLVNAGEAPDPAVAQEYLELAADFLSSAENDKAAQIVRRRAAVAGCGSGQAEPSQDVA